MVVDSRKVNIITGYANNYQGHKVLYIFYADPNLGGCAVDLVQIRLPLVPSHSSNPNPKLIALIESGGLQSLVQVVAGPRG